jgi:hypothetical protein
MKQFSGAKQEKAVDAFSTFTYQNIWLKMAAESWTGLSRTRAYGQTHRDTVAFDDADGLDQIEGMRHIELRRVDVNIPSSAFSSQFLFVMSTIYSFIHPSPRERTSRPCIYAIHQSPWLHDPPSTYAAAAAVPAAAAVVAKVN